MLMVILSQASRREEGAETRHGTPNGPKDPMVKE